VYCRNWPEQHDFASISRIKKYAKYAKKFPDQYAKYYKNMREYVQDAIVI
jgi:hypothetical protein